MPIETEQEAIEKSEALNIEEGDVFCPTIMNFCTQICLCYSPAGYYRHYKDKRYYVQHPECKHKNHEMYLFKKNRVTIDEPKED